MTVAILAAVLVGIVAGHWVIPPELTAYCGDLITAGLCLILFLVGIDMGKQGNVLQSIREAGFRVLLIPCAVVLGTLTGGLIAGLILPLSIKDAIVVSAGFGWYSLAPMLIADYSTSLSAVAFLANVMREIGSIILIPMVAKRIGFIECAGLPGAAAMDTVLPVVVESTHQRITVYSFVSGMVITILMPILVPILLAV